MYQQILHKIEKKANRPSIMRTTESKSGKRVRYSDEDLEEANKVLFTSDQFMF